MDTLQISKGPTFLAPRHGWDQALGCPYSFRGLPPHTPLSILVWQERDSVVHGSSVRI